MSDKSRKSGLAGKVAAGTVIAAAAGYVAGILTAPKSGKDTREDIKIKANETYHSAEKELKKLHTELNEKLTLANEKINEIRENGGKKIDEILSHSNKAKDKARDVLSSLHDGDVNDKDLKNAITEATKAIENLRKYLQK